MDVSRKHLWVRVHVWEWRVVLWHLALGDLLTGYVYPSLCVCVCVCLAVCVFSEVHNVTEPLSECREQSLPWYACGCQVLQADKRGIQNGCSRICTQWNVSFCWNDIRVCWSQMRVCVTGSQEKWWNRIEGGDEAAVNAMWGIWKAARSHPVAFGFPHALQKLIC